MLSRGLLNPNDGRLPGKPEWTDVLAYVADLHRRSIRQATGPLPYDYEEIGPGYCYGPAFGHFDIVHQILDTVVEDPEHAKRQILNDLAVQRPDGSIPAPIWLEHNPARNWVVPPTPGPSTTHPPLWPVAVEAYLRISRSEELLVRAYASLCRLLAWFDAERQLADGGYFYDDVRRPNWESGMDYSVRFKDRPPQPAVCVDATTNAWTTYDLIAPTVRRCVVASPSHVRWIAEARVKRPIQPTCCVWPGCWQPTLSPKPWCQ
jgi:hypothetical protein